MRVYRVEVTLAASFHVVASSLDAAVHEGLNEGKHWMRAALPEMDVTASERIDPEPGEAPYLTDEAMDDLERYRMTERSTVGQWVEACKLYSPKVDEETVPLALVYDDGHTELVEKVEAPHG